MEPVSLPLHIKVAIDKLANQMIDEMKILSLNDRQMNLPEHKEKSRKGAYRTYSLEYKEKIVNEIK